MDRDLTHQLISAISSHDLYAQFRVEVGHKLVVTGKLTAELTELVKAHKQELIDYLISPPDIIGICRHGHKVQWRCTAYGLWVCGCYYQQSIERKIVKR